MQGRQTRFSPGQVIGKWTVLERISGGDGVPGKHRCRCACGRESLVKNSKLVNGESTQCVSCRSKTHGESVGIRGTREYRAWQATRIRCLPSFVGRKSYFDRGIVVCADWSGCGGFERFLAHVGRAPSEGHSLDRIDNSKGYEPGNVRWVTAVEQARNTRFNVVISVGGESRCLAEWLEVSGVGRSAYYSRLKRGMTREQALGLE